MENNKPIIGILLGDPSGIGPELISKLLQHQEIKKLVKLVKTLTKRPKSLKDRTRYQKYGVPARPTPFCVDR